MDIYPYIISVYYLDAKVARGVVCGPQSIPSEKTEYVYPIVAGHNNGMISESCGGLARISAGNEEGRKEV